MMNDNFFKLDIIVCGIFNLFLTRRDSERVKGEMETARGKITLIRWELVMTSQREMETERSKITLIRQETDRVKITFIRQELVTTCLGSTTSTSGSHTATCPITLMSKP